MELASKELVGIISYLLPGFLAAWIFYGLTAHPKPQPFERVVQALIFTATWLSYAAGVETSYFRHWDALNVPPEP